MNAQATGTSDCPQSPTVKAQRDEFAKPAAAAVTLPVIANWFPAALLAAAFFMPQVNGCDKQPVYPVEAFANSLAEDPAGAVLTTWQHFYGLFVIVLFAAVLITDRRTSDRKLAFSTIGFWLIMVASLVIGTIFNFDSSDDLAGIAAMLPCVLLPSYWCYASLKRHDWISAWARIASCIALLGIAWTYLSYIFNTGSRYGIFVTIASLFSLAVAPWWLRVNWRCVLIDRREPATPIRFKIWHLMAVTTLFGLVYGYYRYLVPALEP